MPDSNVVITADRVAVSLREPCLLQLLEDLVDAGLLAVTTQVFGEVCGRAQGENCRSEHCRELCRKIMPADIPERDVETVILLHRLDVGEASALALALKLREEGAEPVLLTADGTARRAAATLEVEVHGDLYLVEIAKALGYCTPATAAAIARSLPRLGRYLKPETAEKAAEKLEKQKPQTS